MRRLGIGMLVLVALLVPATGATAAADDPWVAYVVNSVVTRGGQQSAVVLRSNPVTGALEEVSRNGVQGSLFEHPYDIAVAPGGGSLYVVDMGAFASGANPAADGRIIRVDAATGAQSLVSQGGELVDPAGIAVAPDGALFVVENVGVDQDPAVIRIDPASGAQSVLTRGGNLCYPFGIALEPSGNLIVTDFGDLVVGGATQIDCPQDFGSVVRVTPAGGQSILSFNNVPNPGNLLRGTFGAAVEPGGGVLVVNQTGAQAAVAAINPQNGGQTAVTPNSSPNDAFELPQRVAVLPDGNLLVADYALNDQEGGLVSVDRATGAGRIMRQGTLFNNPLGVTTVVNRPPSAAITFSPQRVAGGKTVTYDASGSADPEGLGLRYAWDLDGNGSFELSTGGVPRATTSFNQSTTMTPLVRVLDPHAGEAVAAATSALVVDTIRPVISSFRTSSRTIATSARASAAARRRSVRFRFRLSEAARVRIAIERALAGRRKGGRCVAPAKARKGAKRCTRWRAVTTLRKQGRTGPNSVRFSGKVRGRALRAGRYRALATAKDAVGNRSRPPRKAGFSAVHLAR
jgi:DNA-binding beta-propeller fold protein YncE